MPKRKKDKHLQRFLKELKEDMAGLCSLRASVEDGAVRCFFDSNDRVHSENDVRDMMVQLRRKGGWAGELLFDAVEQCMRANLTAHHHRRSFSTLWALCMDSFGLADGATTAQVEERIRKAAKALEVAERLEPVPSGHG